jgi:hypothetical protein
MSNFAQDSSSQTQPTAHDRAAPGRCSQHVSFAIFISRTDNNAFAMLGRLHERDPATRLFLQYNNFHRLGMLCVIARSRTSGGDRLSLPN